ncbi:MAG: hypothetical protein ACXAEU_10760 [Candidatus Hodarchaeales archaeon]|jgi:hypothetical protein
MKTSSFRLDESQDKEIEEYAKKMKIDKSAAARKLLAIGIRENKKKEAIEHVRLQQWTIWKAASYCGESYRSFLKIIRAENVPFPLSVDELERELDDNSSQ